MKYLLILLFCSVLFAEPPVASNPFGSTISNAVSGFHFDQTSFIGAVVVDSISGYTATGTGVTSTSGLWSGKCASFDGVNDWIDLQSSSVYLSTAQGTASFAISVWCKLDPTGGNSYAITKYKDSTHREWVIAMNVENPNYQVRFFGYDEVTNQIQGRSDENASTILMDGSWHHLYFAHIPTGAEEPLDWAIYLDGYRTDDSSTYDGSPWTSLRDTGAIIRIGSRGDGAYDVKGYFEDFIYSNVAGSTETARRIYNAGIRFD